MECVPGKMLNSDVVDRKVRIYQPRSIALNNGPNALVRVNAKQTKQMFRMSEDFNNLKTQNLIDES